MGQKVLTQCTLNQTIKCKSCRTEDDGQTIKGIKENKDDFLDIIDICVLLIGLEALPTKDNRML